MRCCAGSCRSRSSSSARRWSLPDLLGCRTASRDMQASSPIGSPSVQSSFLMHSSPACVIWRSPKGTVKPGPRFLLSVGLLEAMSGSGDDWRRPFDEAKAIADDLGLVLPMGAADYPMVLGWAELEAGDAAASKGLAALEFRRVGAPEGPHPPRFRRTAIGGGSHGQGRFDEVSAIVERGRAVAALDDLDAQVRWRAMTALLRSHEGRHDQAQVLASEAVARVAKTEFVVLHCNALMWSAVVLRAAGDAAAARQAADTALHLARQKQNRASERRIDAFLAELPTPSPATAGQ